MAAASTGIGSRALLDRGGGDDRDEEIEGPTSGLQRIVWSVDTDRPAVALTFDDGPDPEFTPRVLDVLARFDAAATFMVVGHSARRHPALLREVVAAGHEVGNHSWSHRALSAASVAQTRSEIDRGLDAIDSLTGRVTRVFRPPQGRLNEAAVRYLALRGQDIVLWSVTRGELGWRAPDRIAAHVTDEVRPGAIVDLHDGIGRGAFNPMTPLAERLRERRRVEMKALARIVEGILERGFELVTVSELLEARVTSSPGTST